MSMQTCARGSVRPDTCTFALWLSGKHRHRCDTTPDIETPQILQQHLCLDALAASLAHITAIAFDAAFRNQHAHSHVPTQVRINKSRFFFFFKQKTAYEITR